MFRLRLSCATYPLKRTMFPSWRATSPCSASSSSVLTHPGATSTRQVHLILFLVLTAALSSAVHNDNVWTNSKYDKYKGDNTLKTLSFIVRKDNGDEN